MANQRPWEQYGFEIGNGEAHEFGTGDKFSTLFHATTPRAAASIVSDRKIKAHVSLSEKGKIISPNGRPVVWMMPNKYPSNCQFGSIALEFDFATLTNGLTPYWFPGTDESECKILFSRSDLGSKFQEYDPAGQGPWRKKDGAHYHRPRHTVRFLFDEDVQTQGVDGQFVGIRLWTPATNPRLRPYDQEEAGVNFLGLMIENSGIPICDCPEVAESGSLQEGFENLASAFQPAVKGLISAIEKCAQQSGEEHRGISANDPQAEVLAKCMMLASRERCGGPSDLCALVSLFESPSEAVTAIESLIKDKFHLDRVLPEQPSVDDLFD